MKNLVIGGNRFFGKKLTAKLIEDNNEITLLNRGNIDDGFGNQIKRIKCDRTEFKVMQEALKNQTWDLVYDQVCYTYNDAKTACELFNGKTKKFIHTSTVSVYEKSDERIESDYDPSTHQFSEITTDYKTNYAEAKRQAEVAFTKFANFPLTMLRIPIVVGQDDYTGRLKFHINKIKNNEPFYLPNLNAKISFITSDDAAETLYQLGKSNFTGIINAASPEPIKLQKFVKIFESKFKNKANLLATNESDELYSPYGTRTDMTLNTNRLQNLNIKLCSIDTWFKQLSV